MATISRGSGMDRQPQAYPLIETEARPATPLEPDDCESATTFSVRDEKQEHTHSSFKTAVFWTTVNIFATIGIVFINKRIFSNPSWKLCQLSFACSHFLLTWFTLFILSRPQLDFFTPRHASFGQLIPLAMAMCLNVVLPNLSLAFSSITFYQVVRILLTPVVAVINFALYRATLPRNAIISLIPVCVGIGIVSYYDSLPPAGVNIEATSFWGIFFAFTGIFASSLYTVWIGSYHAKFRMNSMQLLYCQTPIASCILLYAIPFLDTFPDWATVSISGWVMVILSGAFAILINISQFFIVAHAGPVSSTVIGHLKTCAIVALGWITSGHAIGDKPIIGAIMAITGIIVYSIIITQHSKAHRSQSEV